MSGSSDEAAAEFVRLYDQTILHPMTRAQYGGSGFYNVGDWSGNPPDVQLACAALVDRHIAAAQLNAPGLRILDAGCGLGDSTARIQGAARSDAEVVGINISEAQLADARLRHPHLTFVQMDAARLSFEPAEFDRMIAVESVFHFNSRAAFLQAALKVLRPGGLLVLTDVLFTPASDPWDWWVPAVNRSLSLDGYAGHASALGFEVQSIEDITSRTWTSFCANLRTTGRQAAADRIESWVANYILAVLRRPASSCDD